MEEVLISPCTSLYPEVASRAGHTAPCHTGESFCLGNESEDTCCFGNGLYMTATANTVFS